VTEKLIVLSPCWALTYRSTQDEHGPEDHGIGRYRSAISQTPRASRSIDVSVVSHRTTTCKLHDQIKHLEFSIPRNRSWPTSERQCHRNGDRQNCRHLLARSHSRRPQMPVEDRPRPPPDRSASQTVSTSMYPAITIAQGAKLRRQSSKSWPDQRL
jgi:hypothetical protein